ncbi:MAG TPA: septum formation family protein, partial [Mycobacterium sp.]|nr:septum formation family protein [Mycobacterium sp.]
MFDEPTRDAPTTAGAPETPTRDASRVGWLHSLKATSTRRALLLTALGGLLIAGLITALPVGRETTGLAAYLEPPGAANGRVSGAFHQAAAGNCLNWPENNPDAATIVDCQDDHRFEVAEAIDMNTFPGAEYGPNAAPPTATRIQQISAEQCQVAVERYLGPKFDPNGRYTVSMLWSGDKAWKSGERRMLCGLQLPGPNNQQVAFKGKVADVDQSKVWPAGTCVGIDTASNQPDDVPVDCAAPHAMEITGAVNLAEKFPAGLPAEADQDAFIKETCNRLTDAYLAPAELRNTTLTLIYNTVSLPSWMAGSHQVACSVGATLGNGGWATLVNSAKGPLLINGQPPVAPPDIPTERLNLPPALAQPVPMSPDTSGSASSGAASSGSSDSGSSGSSASGGSHGSGSSSAGSGASATDPSHQTQHIPGQQANPGPAAGPAPAPPPSGNVFNPQLPGPAGPPMDSLPAAGDAGAPA